MIAGFALVFGLWAMPAAADGHIAPHVARLNHAGFRTRSHCTASLVGPGHIVTAAHCIPDNETEIVLLFGYDREVYDRVLRTVATRFKRADDQDLAIWCNAAPDESGFATAAGTNFVTKAVLMVGYGMPAQYRRQETFCETGGASATTLSLTCQVTPGTSGAPVLAQKDGELTMFGVTSASGPSGTRIERVSNETLARLCNAPN